MMIINSTYSPEGLLMQRGNISFNYHANNRLARVDNAGTVLADYSYNATGERVTKVVNGISTNFFYDEQGQLIGEYDATGNMLAQYVYAPSGRLATLKADGNILFHHNDHLGTPQAMSDSNKRVVWQASYTPFGIATVDEDPDLDGISETNNFRFPGQYHDAETGLSYNYFRYYDPETGRYITSDPIGLKGGLNTFAYVGGNPVGAVDPDGLDAIYINYDYYPVSTPIGKMPLGHGAVVAVDPKTGTTKYYEFGRYGDPKGIVRGAPDINIPNVKIGKGGFPTEKSLKKLYDYLSKNLGKGSKISSKYYENSDYQGTIDFSTNFKKNHSDYSIISNNCKTFGSAAATACQEGKKCP